MDFISKTIAPAGRNKYGYYYAATNITKSVVNTTYGGNSTTTTIADTGTTDNSQDNIGFYAILSKTSTSYDALDLPGGIRDSVSVIAYRGYDKAPTLICDLSSVSAVTEDDIVTDMNIPENMGVLGVPSGMSISFTDNGTSAATMNIYVNNSLSADSGKIEIPVVIYKRSDAVPVGDDVYDWWDSQADCEQIWLDLYWRVNRDSATPYFLDLSNQSAGVNCDTEGNIYSASTATLTCSAFTYLGETLVTGVTYERIIDPTYNAHGVNITSINGVGVLSWQPNFGFQGDTLPIDIVAKINDNRIGTKTMTISKNYPGVDGTDAYTRWIVTDADVVRYNPNDRTFSPNKVTGRVMLQVGAHAPVFDSGTTIYEWVNDYEEWRVATSAGTLTQNMSEGISAVTFALYSPEAGFYEQEDVPVISNGLDGQTGPQGPAGENGASAASVWVMTMSNDNASINASNDGTILNNAIRPSNNLKLWYGEELQLDASFVIDYWMDGTTRKTSTSKMHLSPISDGVVTLSFDGGSSGWTFTADTAEIVINAYDSDNELRDTKVMSITKSRAGSNGNTPYISGGTWWIDGTDTGITAEGQDGTDGTNGETPHIGSNGNWWIGNTDTGVKAEGQDGTDGVSYFLIPEYDEIIYDPNTQSCDPDNLISCECYKQEGESTPVPATDVTIKYRKQNRLSSTWTSYTTMPNAGLSFNAADCVTYKRFRFGAFLTASDKIVDQEDVDILMNGTSGLTGGQGRTGAAIRGPYDYYTYSADTQHYWYDGKESTLYPEAERWIDVVVKDNTYYYCVQSYRGNLASYINNTTYWATGTSFDFVAANLIMANNAKIKFLSGNEIYLMSGNSITAGLAGGSGITFWSGAEDPDQGLFKVDASGSFSSTTGLMGGWAYNTSGMSWDYTDGDYSEDAQFGRNGLSFSFETVGNRADFEAGTDGIKFSQEMPNGNALSIDGGSVTFTGDGAFNLGKVIQNKNASGRYGVKVYDNLSVHDNVTFDNDVYNVVGSAYGSKPKIAFVTTSSTYTTYFSAVTTYIDNGGPNTYRSGYWAFNGDMKVANWSENGGSGMYMVLATTAMSRVEIEITDFAEAEHTYKTWRTGAAANDYVVDVLFSGGTLYRCNTSYTGNLNFPSNTSKWVQESWDTIRSNRYYWGDEMKASVDGWPEANRIGIPRRWVGMWCACDSSNPTSNSSFIPTGIYGPTFNNRKGDTLYFEV